MPSLTSSIEAGSSMNCLKACRKRAPVAPSITRWSQDMVTVITVATSILPSTTTARFSPAPTARIAACGGLMTAVKSLIAEHAEIGDREAAAFEFLRLQLLGAGAFGERFHFVGDDGEALFFGAEDDRRDEAEIERDGDADIGMLVAQDRGVGPARIDFRHAHQRERAGLHDEIVDGELVSRFPSARFRSAARASPADCRCGNRSSDRNAGSASWPRSAGARWTCASSRAGFLRSRRALKRRERRAAARCRRSTPRRGCASDARRRRRRLWRRASRLRRRPSRCVRAGRYPSMPRDRRLSAARSGAPAATRRCAVPASAD